jgi:hypothetical protein
LPELLQVRGRAPFATARISPICRRRTGTAMNIFDKGFSPSEAQIRYLDGDYVVLRPGSFVRCAITGKPIPIDELIYWNVDRQEPYADAAAAHEAFVRHGLG